MLNFPSVQMVIVKEGVVLQCRKSVAAMQKTETSHC